MEHPVLFYELERYGYGIPWVRIICYRGSFSYVLIFSHNMFIVCYPQFYNSDAILALAVPPLPKSPNLFYPPYYHPEYLAFGELLSTLLATWF